jgi:hypothetical protein
LLIAAQRSADDRDGFIGDRPQKLPDGQGAEDAADGSSSECRMKR